MSAARRNLVARIPFAPWGKGPSYGAPHPGSRALVPLLAGTFVGTLNNNIVNVPLRRMMADLHVQLSRGVLVVISFNLSLAVAMPVAGWCADRFGRRNLFGAAVCAVAVTSIGASFAPSIAVLVGFRILQGLSAAAILPCVMGIISDLYGQEGRGRALGLWAAANGFGQTVGPPLGGLLAAWMSWRAVFLPAVPVALFAAFGAFRLIPSRPPSRAPLEWRGAAALSGGVGLLLTAAMVAPSSGILSPGVLGLLAGGLLALGALVGFTRRRPAPFLDPQLFREASFLRSTIAVCAQMFCLGATLLAVPLALTGGGQRGTAEVGFVVFALPATMTLFAPLSGYATERLGARRVLRAGMTVLIGGQVAMLAIMGSRIEIWPLVAALVVTGIGIALVQTPAATGATRSVAGRVGTGLGLFNLVRFAGSALGGSWVAIVLAHSEHYGVVFGVCAGIAALGLLGTWLAPGLPVVAGGGVGTDRPHPWVPGIDVPPAGQPTAPREGVARASASEDPGGSRWRSR